MTQDRPRLQAPPGATDTHMHFYDTAERYPVAPTAAFLPPAFQSFSSGSMNRDGGSSDGEKRMPMDASRRPIRQDIHKDRDISSLSQATSCGRAGCGRPAAA